MTDIMYIAENSPRGASSIIPRRIRNPQTTLVLNKAVQLLEIEERMRVAAKTTLFREGL